MATVAEARGEILNYFGTFWNAQVAALTNPTVPVPPIAFQNTDFDPEKDVKPWPSPYVEIDIQHIQGGIASLGAPGDRRFRREGVVLVRIHTLKGDKDALGGTVLNDLFTQIAMDAFDGVHLTGNIWFRDVFPVGEGPNNDGQFFRTNVTAEFEYDEIK